MPRRRRRTILSRLIVAYLVPTLALVGAFAAFAHRAARRSLEEELGRRLTDVARAAALSIHGVETLLPGDEGSRTYRNVRRKLVHLRDATRAARIYVFDRALQSRCDSAAGVPIATHYYRLEVDRAEIERVFAGGAAASTLFRGPDGALVKSGYAPVRSEDDGRVVAAVAVEASAGFFSQLVGLRRALAAFAIAGAAVVVAVSVLVGRRIVRPLSALVEAARGIGRGELAREVAVASPDEIGFLAQTLNEMRVSIRSRDERMQMMLAGIAHEVRNPLGAIELFAGLLSEEVAGDEEKLGHVRRIERELAHLRAVVGEFLDYARRPRPVPEPVDCGALAAEVRDCLHGDGARAGVELRVEPVEGKAVAFCDRTQVRRAVLNLARNALQATPPGGRVTLACVGQGGRVRITVTDTGCGIPPERIARVFQPFFTTKEKGIGLGLAFAREIAEEHGGSLQVESRPGEGAIFRLDLPVVPA